MSTWSLDFLLSFQHPRSFPLPLHILNQGPLSSIYPRSLSSSVQQFLSSCCLLWGYISLSLSLCRSMCAFLHVSVWRTRMTQWCWNERSRAWAFLSKRTIKPYAVHNELTLIQLRCTSCPSVFSLFQFPSFLPKFFLFQTCTRHTRSLRIQKMPPYMERSTTSFGFLCIWRNQLKHQP